MDVRSPCHCGASSYGTERDMILWPCRESPMADIPDYSFHNRTAQLHSACANALHVDGVALYGMQPVPRQGMWLGCPNPVAQAAFTFTEPLWVMLYTLTGLQAAVLLAWIVYKRSQEQRLQLEAVDNGVSEKMVADCEFTNSQKGERSLSSETTRVDAGLPFNRLRGYRDNIFGSTTLGTLVVTSVTLVMLLAVITADYYGSLPGPSFSLTHGSSKLSASIFILVWYLTALWFVGLTVVRARLRNFFRIQTLPTEGTWVQVEQTMVPMVLLNEESRLLRLMHRYEDKLRYLLGWHVHITTTPLRQTTQQRLYFNYQCTRFVYDDKHKVFAPFEFDIGVRNCDILRRAMGLTHQEAEYRRELLGPNFVSVKVPSFASALAQEFVGFFYLYQLIILWLFYYFAYYQIGLVDTGVILVSALIKVTIRIKSECRLKSMAEHKSRCKVLRDHAWKTISTSELVPGDVYEVLHNQSVPCDSVSLAGNIVVNESSLTGEPLPIRKFPLRDDNGLFDSAGSSKNNILYAGTNILQAEPVNYGRAPLAMAFRTGTLTDKGQLVRKILYPAPVSFIFNEQLKIVLAILAIQGMCMFGFSVWLQAKDLTSSWFYGMFALAQLISPLLPAALMVGQSVASSRLREQRICCVDLPRIMIAGKVQMFCFDKTGTLTKEGLEFYGGQPLTSLITKTTSDHLEAPPQFGPRKIDVEQFPRLLKLGVVSCHAVADVNKQLIGNPVDIEMFKSTGWDLCQPEKDDCLDTLCDSRQASDDKVHVVKRYEFDHARASMSVAVLDPTTNHVHIYVKGSFEKLRDLASASSIPSDYDHVTAQLARQGCYVLAMAHRDLGPVDPTTLHQWSRDQMEQGIALIGLVLFKNNLKPDTADAIAELKQGATRTVMITGDTALTGVFIARACGLAPPNDRMLLGDIDGKQGSVVWTDVDTDEVVDLHQVLLDARQSPEARDVELAVTGKAFNLLVMRDQIREYLLNIRVFARMTPQDKVDCVQLHMERGITAMCGDGGNDCGALRAAHVGLALSEAEASIVSPFSSSVRSIFSCVELLRQGRSALATSFAEYKYLILYGQTMAMLKFATFYFSTTMSQALWIIVDAFITVGMSAALSMSKAATRLAPSRPTARILGPQTLFSTIGLVVINMCYLLFGFIWLYQQDWFRCHEFNSMYADLSKWWLIGDNYETAFMTFMAAFQFVNNAAVYNFGHLYRQSWWRNYTLVLLWAVFLAIMTYVELADPNWLGCLFRLNCGNPSVLERMGYGRPDFYIEPYNVEQGHNILPREFRYKLFAFNLGNVLTGILWEKLVVLGPVRQMAKSAYQLDRLQLKL
ncbi:hypothetical protein H4R35_003562 [Dimargaris xerosporica]|nr:hypothetical protein H4R35_003562 [Dimargaris xerosporica]